jgi:hypothetical protein
MSMDMDLGFLGKRCASDFVGYQTNKVVY